ncbi:MAG: (2Fe-2S)-binding protein [Armatimonadota bacterium]|nr:(2Fe-2S)-binding protein [Armatimonadota bacterium]MDW8024933.1 (2Fe-2S)-binding protein [Armatimonadota bacterium]
MGKLTVELEVNGVRVTGLCGEMVASLLWRLGYRSFRHSPRLHEQRGIFCGMGVCFECQVGVDYGDGVLRKERACMVLVSEGLRVFTEV